MSEACEGAKVNPKKRAALSRIEEEVARDDPALESALARLDLAPLATPRRRQLTAAICLLAPVTVFILGCLLGNITILVVAIVAAPVCPIALLVCVPRARRCWLPWLANAHDARRSSGPRK